MHIPTALIGMSGGVDSSVAAWLMQQQGFDCTGCCMELYPTPGATGAEDARAVAEGLGIPFRALDNREEFRKYVLEDFVSCYEGGSTPNPCIQCNRHLKFGAMLDWADRLDCDYIVTGHYARIRRDEETGRYLLLRARDRAKDQTYFLYCLTQRQLSRTRFPLGELTKAQVRQIAQEQGFLTARKRDSQDICFVPGGDYMSFLQEFTGKEYASGDYLDLAGNRVGTHRGAVAYTLGQRKGLGLAMGEPVYVCAKDMLTNTVTVGPNESLYTDQLVAANWNWIPFPALQQPLAVTAKTRHSQKEAEAMVYPLEAGRARVEFLEPQRAITPGQAVVLYQGDVVIGGGTIL